MAKAKKSSQAQVRKNSNGKAFLFRLVRNTSSKSAGSVIPYSWLEVLAIVPRGIEKVTKEHLERRWAKYLCSNWYVCRTEDGLQQVPEGDVWAALDSGELIESK